MDEESDDDMETNFANIQKEERMSAKLGLKEDLEDIRREEEEEKRKAAKRKALAKSKKRWRRNMRGRDLNIWSDLRH